MSDNNKNDSGLSPLATSAVEVGAALVGEAVGTGILLGAAAVFGAPLVAAASLAGAGALVYASLTDKTPVKSDKK